MKSTIKFNQTIIPGIFRKFLPCAADLRDLLKSKNFSRKDFSSYMLSVYNGKKIFKSTSPLRHKLSNEIFLQTVQNIDSAVIIDVGASDGSTSLDLIEILKDNFSKYYVTDISFYLNVINKKGNTYFYDPSSKNCLIIVNNYFIIFKDEKSTLNPIKIIANYLISKAPTFDPKVNIKCNLCQPDLLRLFTKDSRIIMKEWDIFNRWDGEKADFIKAANILNKSFFLDEQLIEATKNIKGALKEGGKLLIVENREIEKWSLFEYNDSKLEHLISENGGSEILDFLNNKF